MKRMAWLILVAWAFCGLTACSSSGGSKRDAIGAESVGKTLRASGYSHFDDSGAISVNQRWLKAQQSAKLAAYREMADQLYKEPLAGGGTLGSQIMRDETYRVYMDTYLRGSRPVDYRTVKDVLKATVELNLSPRFYRCMSGDTDVVNQCLQEDGKLPFTRIGYKSATKMSVNMACSNRDCSDQFFVQGFSKQRNQVDDVLLDLGAYDTEWMLHTGADLAARYFLLQGLIHAF